MLGVAFFCKINRGLMYDDTVLPQIFIDTFLFMRCFLGWYHILIQSLESVLSGIAGN